MVSENTETEIARHQAEIARDRAMDKISWALRELTANLLRVTRGAGKRYEIATQALALCEAFIEYKEAGGHSYRLDEIPNPLSTQHDWEVTRQLNHENRELYSAEQSIICGALQIAASRLIGQRTQEAAGHREMYDGLQRLERLRASAKPARGRKNEWDDLLDKDASRASAEPARRRATKRGIGKERRCGGGPKT
jgi:hypothetical protein